MLCEQRAWHMAQGKRELKALGGDTVLTGGRPLRRRKICSEPVIACNGVLTGPPQHLATASMQMVLLTLFPQPGDVCLYVEPSPCMRNLG